MFVFFFVLLKAFRTKNVCVVEEKLNVPERYIFPRSVTSEAFTLKHRTVLSEHTDWLMSSELFDESLQAFFFFSWNFLFYEDHISIHC